MNEKSCFFISHRETAYDIMPALKKAIERHITEYEVMEFIVGHYGNFDRFAAKAVIATKQFHQEITLSLLFLYHHAERPIEETKGFDTTCYPPGMEKVPRRYAIVRANRYTSCGGDWIDIEV